MPDLADSVAHGIEQDQPVSGRRAFLRLLLLVLVLSVVAGSYLAIVSHTAGQGRHIQQLEKDLFDVRAENQHIEVQLAEEESVQRLLKRAQEEGFVVPDEVEYLVAPSR